MDGTIFSLAVMQGIRVTTSSSQSLPFLKHWHVFSLGLADVFMTTCVFFSLQSFHLLWSLWYKAAPALNQNSISAPSAVLSCLCRGFRTRWHAPVALTPLMCEVRALVSSWHILGKPQADTLEIPEGWCHSRGGHKYNCGLHLYTHPTSDVELLCKYL